MEDTKKKTENMVVGEKVNAADLGDEFTPSVIPTVRKLDVSHLAQTLGLDDESCSTDVKD